MTANTVAVTVLVSTPCYNDDFRKSVERVRWSTGGKMKLHILASGSKRVTATIQNELPMVAVKGGRGPAAVCRRSCGYRAVLPVVLLLGLLFPFLFFGFAFQVLDSATCFECSLLKFFSRSREDLLREELMTALLEVSDSKGQRTVENRGSTMDSAMESFSELARDMMASTKDIRTFLIDTKAMISKMQSEIHAARHRESIYWHLASHGIPNSLHCLELLLDEEYALNFRARSHLPSPEYFPRLSDSSLHHIVLVTDNVLAASVVVTSTIQSSVHPEKLVFHIVTDKKTYPAMHAWFSVNPIETSIVEVKGLHQYYWSPEANAEVEEILDINQLIWGKYSEDVKQSDIEYDSREMRDFDNFLSACHPSLLSHLLLYVPELFPGLNRVVFLNDDVVVQHDISALWNMDLEGKVIGAVVDSWNEDACCLGNTYKDYFNFSDPIISAQYSEDECVWLLGVNIFELQAWKDSNITKTYHNWLKLNLNSGLKLWSPGVLPPLLLAFRGHEYPLDPSWHVAGLGQRSLRFNPEVLAAAAVIHFSGPAKPWLEISNPEVRSLWSRHVNFSNNFIKKCNVMDGW